MLDDSELEAYAKLSRNAVFNSPEYREEARWAVPRAARINIFRIQDEALHIFYEAYKRAKCEFAERMLPGEGFSDQVIEEVKRRISAMDYDTFLRESNMWLLNNRPEEFAQLISSIVSFNQSIGNYEANRKLAEVFQA